MKEILGCQGKMHVRTYTELRTQIHVWRTDKTEKILGRQGKMHVHTCTHMYVRTHTCGDREDVDKYWGKMHCPLKVSRAMKTTQLPVATITLTGGRGKENDDPQRLRKVD